MYLFYYNQCIFISSACQDNNLELSYWNRPLYHTGAMVNTSMTSSTGECLTQCQRFLNHTTRCRAGLFNGASNTCQLYSAFDYKVSQTSEYYREHKGFMLSCRKGNKLHDLNGGHYRTWTMPVLPIHIYVCNK